MYNYIFAKLQNFKLQMQYMVNLLTVSDLSLSKVPSQMIFFSDYLNPDLGPVQAIARVFSETLKSSHSPNVILKLKLILKLK